MSTSSILTFEPKLLNQKSKSSNRSSLASFLKLRRTLRLSSPAAHLSRSSGCVFAPRHSSHKAITFRVQRCRPHHRVTPSFSSSSSEKHPPPPDNVQNSFSDDNSSSKVLTLPTVLTICRVAAVPLLVAILTVRSCAFQMKLGSAFGAFLDPVADKLMVAATLILLCTKPIDVSVLGPVPWLLTVPSIAIIGREVKTFLIWGKEETCLWNTCKQNERREGERVFVPSFLFFETESSPFSLSRNRSSEKAILLLSPWIVDIPAILPVSTPPNGILCLCGSCDYAILPLSPWINWNRKITMSAVREWAASQNGKLLEAVAVNNLGKWKIATQMTALTILLASRDSSVGWLVASGAGLLYVSAGLSVWSLVVYVRKIWKVIAQDLNMLLSRNLVGEMIEQQVEMKQL
ncbi:hypothetical protein F2Q69_00017637 [Brassica cretica]|uniref:CDP-diacylglycerol--glycerol-3-phosphate 3-phosphatidyltransferase n=1 Tax=Brassica cretica TaxID=69181 RepID=A0A8S9QJ60_BRACR|nr:hypothetical protein F2Q69_00017637 [Brassica cretica]